MLPEWLLARLWKQLTEQLPEPLTTRAPMVTRIGTPGQPGPLPARPARRRTERWRTARSRDRALSGARPQGQPKPPCDGRKQPKTGQAVTEEKASPGATLHTSFGQSIRSVLKMLGRFIAEDSEQSCPPSHRPYIARPGKGALLRGARSRSVATPNRFSESLSVRRLTTELGRRSAAEAG